MTKERLKELWPVMEGFLAGRVVQTRARNVLDDPWQNIDEPSWADGNDYRLKAVPREWWVNRYENAVGGNDGVAYDSRENADIGAMLSRKECVRVKEVLE